MTEFHPVVGSRWRETVGYHAGDVVTVRGINAINVNVRRDAAPGKGGRRRKGDHNIPVALFAARYVPHTMRDERMCSGESYVARRGDEAILLQATSRDEAEKELAVINTAEIILASRKEPEVPTVTDVNSEGESVLATLPHKRCGRCGEDKLLGLFNKDRKKADGFQYACKSCQAKQNAEYLARKKGDGPVTVTTSQMIEDRIAEKPARSLDDLKARTLKRFKVRAYVIEERVFTVEADSIPDAYAKAKRSDIEIIAVEQEGLAM